MCVEGCVGAPGGGPPTPVVDSSSMTGADALHSRVPRAGRPRACSVVIRGRASVRGVCSVPSAPFVRRGGRVVRPRGVPRARAEPGCAGLSDGVGDCGEAFGQGAGLVVFLDDAGHLVGAPVGEL